MSEKGSVMNIGDFLELVRTRRSTRKLKPDPLPHSATEQILEAARWAMSGANAQPWEFIVITDQETKNKLAEAHLTTRPDQYLIELTRIEGLRHVIGKSKHTTKGFEDAVTGFKDAPVLILVMGDRRAVQASVLSGSYIPSEGGPDAIYLKNIANATQNLHLAAASLGLGSRTVSVSHTMEQIIKPILNVPEIIDIHTIVAVGYSASVPSTPFRRSQEEFVHYGQYDRSKFRSGDDIIEFVRKLRKEL